MPQLGSYTGYCCCYWPLYHASAPEITDMQLIERDIGEGCQLWLGSGLPVPLPLIGLQMLGLRPAKIARLRPVPQVIK